MPQLSNKDIPSPSNRDEFPPRHIVESESDALLPAQSCPGNSMLSVERPPPARQHTETAEDVPVAPRYSIALLWRAALVAMCRTSCHGS